MMIKGRKLGSYGLYKPILQYLFNMYDCGLEMIALDDDDDDDVLDVLSLDSKLELDDDDDGVIGRISLGE
ncbi:hypothetical protein Tco_1388415, partial [Tanacetum coccineum]